MNWHLITLVTIVMWIVTYGVADLFINIGVHPVVAWIGGFLLMCWLMVSISIVGKRK